MTSINMIKNICLLEGCHRLCCVNIEVYVEYVDQVVMVRVEFNRQLQLDIEYDFLILILIMHKCFEYYKFQCDISLII